MFLLQLTDYQKEQFLNELSNALRNNSFNFQTYRVPKNIGSHGKVCLVIGTKSDIQYIVPYLCQRINCISVEISAENSYNEFGTYAMNSLQLQLICSLLYAQLEFDINELGIVFMGYHAYVDTLPKNKNSLFNWAFNRDQGISRYLTCLTSYLLTAEYMQLRYKCYLLDPVPVGNYTSRHHALGLINRIVCGIYLNTYNLGHVLLQRETLGRIWAIDIAEFLNMTETNLSDIENSPYFRGQTYSPSLKDFVQSSASRILFEFNKPGKGEKIQIERLRKYVYNSLSNCILNTFRQEMHSYSLMASYNKWRTTNDVQVIMRLPISQVSGGWIRLQKQTLHMKCNELQYETRFANMSYVEHDIPCEYEVYEFEPNPRPLRYSQSPDVGSFRMSNPSIHMFNTPSCLGANIRPHPYTHPLTKVTYRQHAPIPIPAPAPPPPAGLDTTRPPPRHPRLPPGRILCPRQLAPLPRSTTSQWFNSSGLQ